VESSRCEAVKKGVISTLTSHHNSSLRGPSGSLENAEPAPGLLEGLVQRGTGVLPTAPTAIGFCTPALVMVPEQVTSKGGVLGEGGYGSGLAGIEGEDDG
jgi:hypothetical protein